ncbi:MAG: TldD/PmbA family protein, partial [Chloroflexi bacterium]|nr:TldD/PmbA family protein [Chloroflexota bacterium]
MNNSTALLELGRLAVRRTMQAGAEQAEAFLQARQMTRIELRNGQVQAIVVAASRGLGLMALIGGARGYVYSPDLRPRSIAELARQAVAMAREVAPDSARALPENGAPPNAELGIFDPRLESVERELKIDLLRRAEEAARASDPRVQDVELARYSDTWGDVALARSDGFTGSYPASSAYLQLTVIGREGGQSLRGYGFERAPGFEGLSSDAVGEQAAYRATASLGGAPVATQRATVVMEPTITAQFLSNVAMAASSEAVLKGRSMLLGRLGQAVASSLVTLVDDGRLPGGVATAPFDDEGVPTRRTVVIERGVLGGYLQSTYTARRTGGESTGNAFRGSYRAITAVAPSNVILAGETDRETLIRGVGRGLYVVTTRNVGGINPVTGDYSVGASGVWIEDGALQRPVSGVTIAGDMLTMLAGIAAVGTDQRWGGGGAGG